jgi:hypothetical protein
MEEYKNFLRSISRSISIILWRGHIRTAAASFLGENQAFWKSIHSRKHDCLKSIRRRKNKSVIAAKER